MGIVKRKLNSKNLRKARLYALNMKVEHNQTNTVKTMEEAGIDIIKIAFLIDENEVKIAVDPQIDIDIEELLKDSDQLLEWGFKLIELEFGYNNYRVTNIEFQDEKVKKYLSNNENLFKSLITAKRMEGKIFK